MHTRYKVGQLERNEFNATDAAKNVAVFLKTRCLEDWNIPMIRPIDGLDIVESKSSKPYEKRAIV